MTDTNASAETEAVIDENTATETENTTGNTISDKLDPEVVAALSQTSETDTVEAPVETEQADDAPVEDAADTSADETDEAPVDEVTPDEAVSGDPGTDKSDADDATDEETPHDDAADTATVESDETEEAPAEPVVDDSTEDAAPEQKADAVVDTKTDDEQTDVASTVVAAFEEFVNGEEIDLYSKVAKINKTGFKNLLNSNQGYDQSASEAFRAEEDKQARKIATKALRDIFREQKIKMKPDEFEKEFPEAYETILDLLAENDVSFAEWEAVTNSVGDENFVHYVEGLSLPFGTSSKQDIEEGVNQVVETLGLTDTDAADSEKNKKAVTSAVKKALKGNGDVKFAFVWRQNAADVVSYFPFETRTAEIENPVLLAVAVKAADAPKSVKLDPMTAQAKLAGTYTFSHRVSEANDGKTVSNVAVHVGDLPNKDSYYEREVEFDNPDEED